MALVARPSRWPFAVRPEKVVEAILFVVPGISNPTLHSVSKVLYQADRVHMARYGRPMTGDHYVAMKHGPVPSYAYDLLKALKGVNGFQLPDGAREAIAVENGHSVRALRNARTTDLSQSELECLRDSVQAHGRKSFDELTTESHDAAWNAADENDIIGLDDFLQTVENRDEVRQHILESGT